MAALLAMLVHPDYRQGEPSLRGRAAKDFDFSQGGKPRRLSDLRGHVVVLNFWARWCQPCVDETPSLKALQQHIAPLGGTILGVSVDEDPAAYDNFLKQFNVAFLTYRDPSAQIPLEYGTTMFPETYIIDRRGRFARKLVGPQDWTSPDMLAYLDSLLKT
jgi:cytochrome c biogenesis protein CcmG, thiol:disulfide interchange protein DsbE